MFGNQKSLAYTLYSTLQYKRFRCPKQLNKTPGGFTQVIPRLWPSEALISFQAFTIPTRLSSPSLNASTGLTGRPLTPPPAVNPPQPKSNYSLLYPVNLPRPGSALPLSPKKHERQEVKRISPCMETEACQQVAWCQCVRCVRFFHAAVCPISRQQAIDLRRTPVTDFPSHLRILRVDHLYLGGVSSTFLRVRLGVPAA